MVELQVERVMPGLRCQAIQGPTIWASKGYRVYESSDMGRTWQRMGRLPVHPAHDLLSRFTPFRRLLRLGVHNLLVLENKIILAVANSCIFRCNNQRQRFELVHELRRGRSPLSQGMCQTSGGYIYYGEYWSNPDREAVHLWRSTDDGLSWETVYTFSAGSIRHIHAVQHDPFTGCLWVATGDRDHECRILCSSDGGRSFEVVGQGAQRWRAVSLMFTPEYVVWGTDVGMDTPQVSNYFCAWRRTDGTFKQLCAVDGPVYYSTQLSGGLLLAGTTVERGGNERDSQAHLWASSDGLIWQDVCAWPKDRWPPIMGYGTLIFPAGQASDGKVYLTGIGLRGLDNVTLQARVAW